MISKTIITELIVDEVIGGFGATFFANRDSGGEVKQIHIGPERGLHYLIKQNVLCARDKTTKNVESIMMFLLFRWPHL